MNFIKIIFLFSFTFFLESVKAQEDTLQNLTFSGYVESFFAYEINRPAENSRARFLYNHNRQNEFNINLGYIKAAYTSANTRANLALATGTYMADNYANEPALLQNILEANAGIRITKNTWLDIGILPSHIGFESAISKDCRTLTRSLLAENSPYFESGARITYTPNDKWTFAGFILNGWQRIHRINADIALGSQITYKPNAKLGLNWSTFYGSDTPDSLNDMRVFNNVYATYQVNKKFGIILGFDYGIQQSTSNSFNNAWYSPVAIAHLQISDKWQAAARLENYTDLNGVIILPDFQCMGYSLNLDYTAFRNAVLRAEARLLDTENDAFFTKNSTTDKNLYFTTSLSISF